MNRQERLKKVKELIERYSSNEAYFDELYQVLLEEYSIEESIEPDLRKNNYLNNLRQTRDKQGRSYIDAKRRRPVKGASAEYKDFVSNFKQDVSEATHH